MDGLALNSDARDTLERARSHARDKGAERADTLQILLALLDSVIARRVFDLFGSETEKLRQGLDFFRRDVDWPADPDAEMRTIDLARAEAARLGHAEVGSEHLLLGVARQPEAFAAVLLQSTGLTLDATREAVRYTHGDVPDWQRPIDMSAPKSFEMHPVGTLTDEQEAILAEVAEQAALFGDGQGMELQRVVAIGEAIDVAGVVVEMIALEMRDRAAVLLWRTRTVESRMLGQPEIGVSDDLGTTFRIYPGSWGGGDHESRGETIIAPRPPEGASSLTIEVHSFRGQEPWPTLRPPRTDPVTGPWRFEVDLS